MVAAELKAGDAVAFTHPETGAIRAATVTCVWRDVFSGARKVNVQLDDGTERKGLTHFPAPYLGHLHTPKAPKPVLQAAPVKRKERASGSQS